MPLPVAQVRKRFPALQQDQVYFDNAGGSQTLDTSIEEIRNYLLNNNVQLGASYAVGQKSTGRYEAAFKAGAEYVNANVDEITYGASTTQLFRNLSWTLNFRPGDEIIVSAIDHESNIAPWVDLAERQGLTLKWWKPQPSADNGCRLTPESLETIITNKTKLVTLTHASNVLGTITDVKGVCSVAHYYGALVCVDAVAYAPHRPIDVKYLGVDFYCFSWYKVYGPHVSMLYASWSAQTHMKSLGHFFNPQVSLTDKLGLAAASYELIQAVPAVVDYLKRSSDFSWVDMINHETLLQAKLLDYLLARPDVTIYGSRSADSQIRLPTISFGIKGWNSQSFVEELETTNKYGIRWGAFYSNRLVRGILGLAADGVIRVSMVHYNTGETFPHKFSCTAHLTNCLTEEEVAGLIAAMDKLLTERPTQAST